MKKLLALLLLPIAMHAGDGCISACECCPLDHSAYLQLSHREPGGIGYGVGYSSIDIFYNFNTPRNYAFFDLRAHLFNDGKWATNAGIGFRKMADYSDVVTGLNFYWDWRDAPHGSYHQIGLGIEALWPYWDFHFNGHIPVGRERARSRFGFRHFEGNRAIIEKKYTLNMGGFDTSVGYWLCKCSCFDLHTSLGGYYFRGNFDQQFGGGLLKAKARFWQWLELEGQVSYDNSFKWVGQGELAINVPFGPAVCRRQRKIACCSEYIALEERLLEQPDRFEILVTDSKTKSDVARHPLTGNPLTFYFVDNTSNSLGTFESPFPTLLDAQNASAPSDAIYVFPGNASYTDNLTLQSQQLLGGSAAPFTVQSRFGKLEIPAQTTSRPTLTGLVAIDNHNRITGLRLETEGITRLNSLATNLHIENNLFINCGFDTAQGVNGTLLVTNNQAVQPSFFVRMSTLNGTAIFTNNTVDAQNIAIGFQDVNGSVLVENNTLSGDISTFVADSLNGELICQQNSLSAGTGAPVIVSSLSGKALIDRNTITADTATQQGILIEAGSGEIIVTNNTIDSLFRGVVISDFDGKYQVIHNQITSEDISIVLDSLNVDGSIQNNTLVATGDSALLFGDYNGSNIIEENHITTSQIGIGISELSDTVTGNLLVRNNVVRTTSADVAIGVSDADAMDAIFTNNTLITPLAAGGAFTYSTESEVSHVRFVKQVMNTPSSPSEASFTNGGGSLELESPNLNLSGVEAMNPGEISTTGAITFVPFN